MEKIKDLTGYQVIEKLKNITEKHPDGVPDGDTVIFMLDLMMYFKEINILQEQTAKVMLSRMPKNPKEANEGPKNDQITTD